ncbi:hypothetical protein Tco_0734592 [Tanacetum coccineum]
MRLRLFQFFLRDQASNWLECLPAGSISIPSQEDLAIYDNESWNDPKDFAKPVKAISLPQDVPMVPYDTQYCMKNPEQAFVNYASSRTVEAGVIMEYFVKISLKACILELKRRNLKNTVMTFYTLYPSRKIWLDKMKVIKEGFEKLGLLKINDDLFACNTPPGTIFDEFNRLSGMDDDLFTHEVEILRLSSIPCDKKDGDDSDDEDLDVYKPRVCYDENDGIYVEAVIFVNKRLVRLMDVIVEQWLDLIYGDHKKVDVKVKEETRGDDEVELTDEEFSNPDDENLIDKGEVGEIFRIETDVFDFETPICKAFDEFNYLLNIDTDLFTSDILGFMTYDEFKNEWMDELNKGIPWVPKELWLENGIPIDDIHHICEPTHFKNRNAKWPTCNSNNEGFCNGGELLGMVRVSYMTYFLDYEWYDDLVDGKLEEEALKQKTIYERSWGDATHEVINFYAWLKGCFKNFHELDYELLVNSKNFGWNDEEDIHEEREPNDNHGIDNFDNDLVRDNVSYHANDEEYEEDRCELLGNPHQEPPVYEIRRFKMIKYTFGPSEKYISIKECEYDNLTRTEDDACHAYQEIFHIMDEGCIVLPVLQWEFSNSGMVGKIAQCNWARVDFSAMVRSGKLLNAMGM